jgi:uncharacterized protein
MLDELHVLSQQYLHAHGQQYKRDCMQSKVFAHRFSILSGQRGVGKTTFIIQHLLATVKQDITSEHILYVPADHFSVNQYALYAIAEAFAQAGGKLIVFDEIHKYQNWSSELKSIYDTFPQLNVIASGSSALEIHKGSHDL